MMLTPNATQDQAPALEASGLVKRYGALEAVSGVSFVLGRGERVVLLGPNGAGKTTLLRMLTGQLRPDAGELRLMGARGRAFRRAVQTQLGYAPQEAVVWPELTCHEQLTLMGRMYRPRDRALDARAARLLDRLGLSAKRDAQARHLSGGMQRRLNLALALIHDPQVLILDEPMAGLDPRSRLLVRDVVLALSRDEGRAVLVSTHDMAEAERLAQRVAVLHQGALLALDTPARLKARWASGAGVVELDFEGAGDALIQRAAAAVGGCAQVASVHTSGARVIAQAGAPERALGPLMAALSAADLAPSAARTRAATLEDVFVALAGRGLEGT